MDLNLLINSNAVVGKVMFALVCNVKSLEFPIGNCKLAWDRLVNKCVLHTPSSLLS